MMFFREMDGMGKYIILGEMTQVSTMYSLSYVYFSI